MWTHRVVCGLSNLPISTGETVYLFAISSSSDSSKPVGWMPCLIAIPAVYDGASCHPSDAALSKAVAEALDIEPSSLVFQLPARADARFTSSRNLAASDTSFSIIRKDVADTILLQWQKQTRIDSPRSYQQAMATVTEAVDYMHSQMQLYPHSLQLQYSILQSIAEHAVMQTNAAMQLLTSPVEAEESHIISIDRIIADLLQQDNVTDVVAVLIGRIRGILLDDFFAHVGRPWTPAHTDQHQLSTTITALEILHQVSLAHLTHIHDQH